MTDRRWPDAGLAVLAELARHRGRLALIPSGAGADLVAERMASLSGEAPFRLGAVLTAQPELTREDELIDLIATANVVTDIDALFWRPRFGVHVLRLLQATARKGTAAVWVWPGTITGNVARYSQPGRADYFRAALTDALLLRPVPVMFDNDPPFEMQRPA